MFKTVSVFNKLSFKITLLVGFFFTSAIIAIAMLMGSESGNFVVQVQSGDIEKSIAITETLNDYSTYVDKITTDGIGNISDNTARYFMSRGLEDLQRMTENTGVNKELTDLYCYTFYVVNTCDSVLNIEFELKISQVTKNLDKAIRVMSYNEKLKSFNIYQALDDTNIEYVNYPAIPRIFQNDKIVFQEQDYLLPMDVSGENLEGSYAKYSIFVWVEGLDPECTDELYHSTIQFELAVKVI